MTKGSDIIEMDSVDFSVYKDCTPLFTGPQSPGGMRFGENSVPILQGLDNPEDLVYFNSPERSMATPNDQFEEDLGNQGQGLEADIFPLWQPLPLEENVFLLPQDPWEDNGFELDELFPQEDSLIAEEAGNGHQVCQDSKRHVGQLLIFSLPKGWNTNVRRCRTKRTGHKNMNGEGLKVRGHAVQIHQGRDQPMAHTIATGSDPCVVNEIPGGPSHASEGKEARRGRGRPRKHAAPSLTQDSSSNKRAVFVLPAGWTKIVVPRINGKRHWRKDTYYIEEATQLQLRSRPEVTHYLRCKADGAKFQRRRRYNSEE